MKVKLQFKFKEVYGRPLYYPENETARTIVKITGRKTLSESDLKELETSFKIEVFGDYSFKNLVDK
jgi:hypothetical protein